MHSSFLRDLLSSKYKILLYDSYVYEQDKFNIVNIIIIVNIARANKVCHIIFNVVPQVCVLSPILANLHTNDRIGRANIIFIRYSDDSDSVYMSDCIPTFLG